MSLTPSTSSNVISDRLQKVLATQYKIYSYDDIKNFTSNFETSIGEGGFSKVYKGFMGNVPVAVKIFKSSANVEDTYIREIKNMVYISHPNVIIIRGLCHETNFCIISDYMSNGSLQDVIDNSPDCMKMDKSSVLNMFIILCKTLEDFHERNFFHMDIKPDNILFDQSGNPKYADFNGSYFFDEERTSYTMTHGGWTQIYMDPFTMGSGFGYYTDMYAFGMTILAVLTKRKNIGYILMDGREVHQSRKIEKIKGYFAEEWQNEIGMKMLSCAMECTKDEMKERIRAKELAVELEKIKYEIDFAKRFEDIDEMRLERRSFPEVPCIVIETKDNYDSSDELSEKLRYIVEVENNFFGFRFKTEKKIKPNIDPLDQNEDQQLKNMFVCYYEEDSIKHILQKLIKLSVSITFCNIIELDIVEPLIIENDIKLASNNNVKLNIQGTNYILIKGDIKVMMANFKVEDCERISEDYCVFNLRDGASLAMKDMSFRNNFNQKSIINVGTLCKLEMKDCAFDDNKSVIKDWFPTCICSQEGSRMTLQDCMIKNHGIFAEAPYECSNYLIRSIGHVIITNCTFENNRNDKSNCISFLFNVEAEVTITNSTFKKCSVVYFADESKGVIRECSFEENGKEYTGGALCLLDDVEVEVDKCSFINNIACQGGAIKCRNKSKIFIKKTIFDGNKTFSEKNGAGGAMLLDDESSGKVEDCRFLNNHAITDGGALAMWYEAKLEIKKCYFEKNVSLNRKGHSIYCERKSNIKEMTDNVYKDSTEEERSNVYIDEVNE